VAVNRKPKIQSLANFDSGGNT